MDGARGVISGGWSHSTDLPSHWCPTHNTLASSQYPSLIYTHPSPNLSYSPNRAHHPPITPPSKTTLSIPPNLSPQQTLALFEALKEGLRNLATGRYALLAGTTLGLYDHILTFDRERQHIWHAKGWTAPRAIFLFTRYSFPLIILGHIMDNLGPERSDSLCLKWEFINTYWTFVMYSMMHWLVALRVYAYWGRSRKVLFSFAVLWSIAFVATTVEAMVWLTQYKSTAAYDPLLKFCTIDAPSWLPVINVGFLILEIPAFCLTAYKFRQDSKVYKPSILINTLIRDGVLYFFVVLGLTTGTALFTYLAPFTMDGVPRFLTLGIVAVTVSRLVLSLKDAAGKSASAEAAGSGEGNRNQSAGNAKALAGSGTYVMHKTRPSKDGRDRKQSLPSSARPSFSSPWQYQYPQPLRPSSFYGNGIFNGNGHSIGNSVSNLFPMGVVVGYGNGSGNGLGRGGTGIERVSEGWCQEQTLVIGNPYAYIDDPSEPARV